MTDKDTEDGNEFSTPTTSHASVKQQGLFGSTGIELTEAELSHSATTKFLRHLNGSQENEIQKLKSFEAQFFDKRQECEVLKKEKEGLQREIDQKKGLENAQKVMISCGTIVLGSMKVFENAQWYVLLVLGIVAAVLIVGGMFPVLRIGASK